MNIYRMTKQEFIDRQYRRYREIGIDKISISAYTVSLWEKQWFNAVRNATRLDMKLPDNVLDCLDNSQISQLKRHNEKAFINYKRP